MAVEDAREFDRTRSALCGPVLAGDPARPTLGEAEAVTQHAHRLAPAGRAQKFPLAISFSARFSSSLSATKRFSWPFSRSSSLRPLDVFGLHAAVLVSPTVQGLLGDLQGLCRFSCRLSFREHLLRGAQLADDLLGSVSLPLHLLRSSFAHCRGREGLSNRAETTHLPTRKATRCGSCSPSAASSICSLLPTGHKPMARWSASTRRWPGSGLTGWPTARTTTETGLCHTGSSTTTRPGPTAHSVAGRRSVAFTTSVGRTSSRSSLERVEGATSCPSPGGRRAAELLPASKHGHRASREGAACRSSTRHSVPEELSTGGGGGPPREALVHVSNCQRRLGCATASGGGPPTPPPPIASRANG